MKMKKKIAVLVVLAAASASFADPIVSNAGFELPVTAMETWWPDLAAQGGSGWAFTGSLVGVVTDSVIGSSPLVDFLAVEGAQVGLVFNPGDFIAQTLGGFAIGTTYTVNWSERARTGFTSGLTVQMDGGDISASHVVPDGAWVAQSVNFTATAASHSLSFIQSGGAGNALVIDDVSIAAIPEPATLGMVTLLGGAMLWIRRRFTI